MCHDKSPFMCHTQPLLHPCVTPSPFPPVSHPAPPPPMCYRVFHMCHAELLPYPYVRWSLSPHPGVLLSLFPTHVSHQPPSTHVSHGAPTPPMCQTNLLSTHVSHQPPPPPVCQTNPLPHTCVIPTPSSTHVSNGAPSPPMCHTNPLSTHVSHQLPPPPISPHVLQGAPPPSMCLSI